MVDLAVDQDHRTDSCIPHISGRVKLRARLKLGQDVRRRIDEDPVARIRAHRDRRLCASFCLERPLAKAAAVTAVTIPLREAAARGSAEDEDSHLAPTGMNGIIAQRRIDVCAGNAVETREGCRSQPLPLSASSTVVLTVPDIHRDFETETQFQKFGFSPSHYRLLAQAES